MARYYYRREAYVAAVNRAGVIVKHYNGSLYVMSALELMVKSYRRLGDRALADKTQTLLDYNAAPITSKNG